MEELLELLRDGNAKTTTQLAMHLHTSIEDIKRKLEYLEMIGKIKRVKMSAASCGGCSGCHGCDSGNEQEHKNCSGCMPSEELMNMGEMWEVCS